MSFMWLISYCDLLSLYLPGYFLSMWLSGIIAITNSYSDSASSWNIPIYIYIYIYIYIFTSAKHFSFDVNYTIQVSVVFSKHYMTSSDTLLFIIIIIISIIIINNNNNYHHLRNIAVIHTPLTLVWKLKRSKIWWWWW